MQDRVRGRGRLLKGVGGVWSQLACTFDGTREAARKLDHGLGCEPHASGHDGQPFGVEGAGARREREHGLVRVRARVRVRNRVRVRVGVMVRSASTALPPRNSTRPSVGKPSAWLGLGLGLKLG